MTTCSMERGGLKQADQDAKDALKKKMAVLRNTMKRDTIIAQVDKNGGIGNALETLHAMLRGTNKMDFQGARDSIESRWHGRSSQWISAVDNEIRKLGLKEVAEKGLLDREISSAMFKLSKGDDAGKGPAVELAKIYGKAIDSARDFVNGAGGDVGDAKGYVTTTQHDPVKLREAAGTNKTPEQAFKAWWDFSRPRMDENTFRGWEPLKGETIEQARERIGKEIFQSLVTGVHMQVGGIEGGFEHPDFAGTTNVQKKVSAHRAIQWKDGESWHEYQQQFGRDPTLHSSIVQTLDRSSRATALMERLGDNPGGQLNLVTKRLQENYKGNFDEVQKFQNGLQNLKNEMGRLDGTLNIPADMGLAKAASAIRSWESMSLLGSVSITHFASIWPSVTSELAHHGINRLEGMGNILASLGRNLSDTQLHDIHSDLGSFAEGIMRHTRNIIGDDSIPGKISNLAGHMMDATGLHFLFDRTKAGIRDMLAHNLGRNISKAWEELDPHISDMLNRYGIGKDEWSLMQNREGLPTWEGRTYLTPSSVADLGKGISDKLLSYYNDAAAHGVVQGGVRERAMLLGSSRPGTGIGEFARFFAQFKMWPLAAMHQILERDIFTSLSKGEAAWNIGMLVALGIPAGYLRMAVSDAVSGRPLRDPTDPRTLLAAAAQSGGLGIFGDYLFGEVNRTGGDLFSTVAGPVFSDANSLYKIFNDWKQGKAGWPDLARFGSRHIPFANLVYLKGALDYLLWYHLYEAASPGWWERTNRRVQKDQGRTMTGYAPGAGVPWGVPGIYLSKGSESSGLLGKGNLGGIH